MMRRVLFLMVIGSFVAFTACGGDDDGTTTDTTPKDTIDETTPEPDAVSGDTTKEDTIPCDKQCGTKECGPSACAGEDCGTCAADEECTAAGMCEPKCMPACDGKECGDNGCGGVCGTCQYGTCTEGACVCEPACDGKVCGPDGCGATCGACDANTICNADQSACEAPSFGKASRFNKLYIPGTADEGGEAGTTLEGAVCLDVSGDGSPNNGLGALLGTLAGFGLDANGDIEEMFAEGTFNILLDLGDDPEAAPFTLSGYLSETTDADGKFLVSPDSYKDGMPMIYFEGAEIDAGKLELGPITFPLGDLLGGFLADAGIPPLDITLEKVMMQATVGGIDDMGVELNAGTLAGAIFKADLDMALYLARQWCATDPEAPTDVCGYISMADMPLIETFLSWDLELDGCGKKLNLYDENDTIVDTEDNCEAVSACIFWSGEKAVIGGLAPVPAE